MLANTNPYDGFLALVYGTSTQNRAQCTEDHLESVKVMKSYKRCVIFLSCPRLNCHLNLIKTDINKLLAMQNDVVHQLLFVCAGAEEDTQITELAGFRRLQNKA